MGCGGSLLRHSLRVLGKFILLNLFCLSVHADETVLVYPDEYVIELPLASSGGSAEEEAEKLLGSGIRSEKQVGPGTHLVRPNFSAYSDGSPESEDRNPVEFNKSRDLCPELLKRGIAKSCSPNYVMHIDTTPNDPSFGQLWGMNATAGIDAPGAWDISTGSTDVVVAVIDTGVDFRHPDLVDNMWTNPGEVPNNNADDDHNGYVDDVYGMSTVTQTPLDDNMHGTHVAGTIAGRGNNGIGVVGVNWRAKIMALKFLDRNGSGSLTDAIETINYMVAMKHRGVNVRVSNNSWGGGNFSEPLFNAIKNARDAGILFIAAAGNAANDNDSNPSYPSSYEVSNVVSVAAIDSQKKLASFSNYGRDTVDIAAPGVNIYSCKPNNEYQNLSGTSMATPHVAGAVALLIAANPGMSNDEILTRLYESGIPTDSLNGRVRASRRLNVGRMLRGETDPLPPPTPTPAPCVMTAQEIAYQPDLSADNAELVMQADELNFTDLSLPFAFPFHRQQLSVVKLSPNGVIYTDHTPGSMDYRNSESAPVSSIGAFHTDLIARTDPNGVRVATSSDKAVIYWKAKFFNHEDLGDVEVRSVLHATGEIDVFADFPASLTNFVQQATTIGVTGPTAGSAVTFAYNSSNIHPQLGVRFTPQCDSDAVLVSSVKGRGWNARGSERNYASPGARITVDIQGVGSGSLALQAAFNGQLCPGAQMVSMANGSTALQARMPRVSSRYRSIQFRAGGAKGSLRIGNKSGAKRSGRGDRISAIRMTRHCESIFQSLTNR